MASAEAVSFDVRDVVENVLENVQLFSKQIKGETETHVMYMIRCCCISMSIEPFHISFCRLLAPLAMHAGDALPVKPRVVDGKEYWKVFGKRFGRSSVVNSHVVVC